MFRRLILGSVTGPPINNPSSDISLFLYNLYLQHSIPDILEFPPLYRTSGCCTTTWRNREKIDPSTSQTLTHPHPPFQIHLIECSIIIGKYKYKYSSSSSLSLSPFFPLKKGFTWGYPISGLYIFLLWTHPIVCCPHWNDLLGVVISLDYYPIFICI